MLYHSKREVLERLGKNPNDNKLVDRMVLRGEIRYEGGVYIIMSEYYENLEWKVKELEKENAELKERSVSIIQAKSVLEGGDADEVERLKQELYEAKTNSDYWEKMYNEEVKDKQNRIRKAFLWIKNIKPSANWEEFRDWILNDNE